jgi:hypothetical protein
VREGHGAAVKTHVQAVVVLACLAKAAVAARARGRDGDALAYLDAGDRCAETIHNARNFVAQSDGLFDAHSAKAAMLVVMQVGSANAAKGHIHAQLVLAQSGQFGVFNAQVFGRVTDNGFHGSFFEIDEWILECGGHATIDIKDMAVHKA